jgi:hypothetical protein
MPETAGVGSPIVTAPCVPVGDPSQAWHFENYGQAPLGSTVARLRFAATGHCLAIAEATAGATDVPLLEACTDTLDGRHLFQLWPNGEISIGSGAPGTVDALCLDWQEPRGVLYFGSCTYDEYYFSGALETPANQALTLITEGDSTELRVTDLGPSDLPADNQIFDYVF